MAVALVALVAYLFGSVPVGVLVARSYGIDIQKVGSGNTGATNVLRAIGWVPALVVFLADALKGGFAVLVAQALGFPGWEVALVALSAVVGHCYSLFLGFRGGKGVATAFGTVFIVDPGLMLAVAVVGIATILVTRFVSAGSIVGTISSIVFAVAMGRPGYVFAICFGLSGLILLKHRKNLAAMYEGQERRIDQRTIRSVARSGPAAGTVPPAAPTAAPAPEPAPKEPVPKEPAPETAGEPPADDARLN